MAVPIRCMYRLCVDGMSMSVATERGWFQGDTVSVDGLGQAVTWMVLGHVLSHVRMNEDAVRMPAGVRVGLAWAR